MKSIDHGAAAEYRCAAELIARGILPSWPSSNMYPYDMIADAGKRRSRIQVKGTNKRTDKIEFSFRMIEGSKRRAYTKQDIDFVVLYSFYHQIWWIIPIRAMRSSITFYPEKSACAFNKYIDRWDLLK